MVKKGQTIGGGQGTAPPRRGGMLPPSGAGPVEVTPEWLKEQDRATAQPAASAGAGVPVVRPVPVQPSTPGPQVPSYADMPDPESDPADQLAVCERAIHSAKARWTAAAARATEAFIDEAGPYLAWVHQNKLYKLMLDNNKKPYRSFARYLKEQHDLERRTGYRITQTIPLLKTLAEAGHALPDLSARQVDALHPVRVQHGDIAVMRVWKAACETKKGPLPTPDELEKAKVLLELTTKPDPDEQEPAALSSAADPGAVVDRATKLLVPDTVRAAVRKDPERVRALVRVLNTALTEAGVSME